MINPRIKFQITNSKSKITKFEIYRFWRLVVWSLAIIWNLVLGIWNLNYLYAQDKVIAIVNQDVITQKDLNDFTNFTRVQFSTEYKGRDLESKVQSMKLNLLHRLIDDRLILQEAKNNKIKIDENRIKARIEDVKRKIGSEVEFQKAIAQQGLVQADLEARIREQMLMQAIIEVKIRAQIEVSPFEVTDFYEKNKDEFQSPQQREFESLAVESQDLAEQIYSQAKAGALFEDLAKKYSLKVNRVSLTKTGELREDVENALFRLGINQISSPIQIENISYIFKLVNIIASRQEKLSEAQDIILNYLLEKKMQEKLENWLDELKKKSYIKILPAD